MRGSAASLLLLVSSTWNNGALAHPYAKDELHDLGYGYLMDRDCYQYCGYDNQYCCSSGSTCYTSAGIAGCSANAGGGVEWYTTTWTETETFTSTYSSYYPAATASAGAACTPPAGSGQIACGSICCASWQYCAYENQCSANVGGGATGGTATATAVTTVITTNGQTITTQYSAPYRVTSGASATTTTGTGVISSATTTSNGTVVATSTGGNLSPGAIAGIVIGTLAGVVILLAICACFVVRGLWHTLLGILGLRKKPKRTETIIEEERYSRRGSVHSRRDRHDSWYASGAGGRPSIVAASRKEKTGGGNSGWLGLGAAAGTLMLLLGLRRDKNRRKASAASKPPRSDYSSTYYSDSYTATTPSK
jgi:hypothetical protein